MDITPKQLSQIMPANTETAKWLIPLNAAMTEFGISANAQRIAAFPAQVAVESGK